mgnify:FL=1
MSVLSPVSAAVGGAIPLTTPHSGGAQLKPIEQNKYNISFCKPTGPVNMEPSQEIESNSQYMTHAMVPSNRALNFNKILNNSRDQLK